jgi:DNA-binding MarR family transcriptional regulator
LRHPYYEAINLIERLHRQFLDLLKVELDRSGIQDINNVQALILYNIGEDELTVGELTARGYYLGSNVSYNLKKMVENGYLSQERSVHDRRSIRVRVSDKGLALRKQLSKMFEGQIEKLTAPGLDAESMGKMVESLRRLERYWQAQLGFATAPFSQGGQMVG